jgi:hypothetical protein
MGSRVARPVVWIRLENDAPEQVEDSYEYRESKELAYPFWQALFGVVALRTRLRGLVWVDVGSEGAIVWGRAYQERRGCGMGRVFVGWRWLCGRRVGV